MRSIAPLVFLALLGQPAFAQGLVVVDEASGPGFDFTEIGPAVAAAGQYDVVLVRSGTYEPFTITKSATVVADDGATVVIQGSAGFGSIDVDGIAANERVVLRGLEVPTGSTGIKFHPALEVSNCAGPVLAEDCFFRSVPIGHPAGGEGDGVRAMDSSSVTLVRCVVEGFNSGGPGTFSAPGLINCRSFVQLFDCHVAGTRAVQVLEGSLFAMGGTLAADGVSVVLGHDFTIFTCNSTGPAVVDLLDVQLVAGVTPTFVISGTLTTHAGNAHLYGVDAVSREGETATERYVGNPGELAALAFSLDLRISELFLQYFGTAHVPDSALLVGRGTVPASGELLVPQLIPELGPGLEGVALFEQGLFLDAMTLDVYLANPSTAVLLDAGL